MSIYQRIADAVISLLVNKYPDRDVTQEVVKSADGSQNSLSKDYFFVEVIPISAVTLNRWQTQYTMQVNVSAILDNPTRMACLQIADELDKLFRPVFYVEDRAITLSNITQRTVDDIVHYSMPITIIDGEMTIDGETMGKIVIN